MKFVLITGASSGIGAACVERFARAGYSIIAIARDVARMDAIASRAKELGAIDCFNIELDLSETDAIAGLREKLLPIPHLDALVNCAGVAFVDEIESTTLSRWDDVMRINVTAPFFLIQTLLPWLDKSDQASIVNVSSIAGRSKSISLGCHYTTSKAALIGMTRHLASELGARGIRVNCTTPSQTHSPMLDAALSPDGQAQLAERVPIKRLAEPSEQANVIYFLCSSEASYMNGAIVDVNGGLL